MVEIADPVFGHYAVPTLTQADLTADKIPGLVDLLFEGNTHHRKLSRSILREQDRLQELCSDDAWLQYLYTEEAVNIRLNFMLAETAKWAFHQGRRSVLTLK